MLAALLSYPDADVRRHLPEMLEILERENALPEGRRAELDALIAKLRGDDPLDEFILAPGEVHGRAVVALGLPFVVRADDEDRHVGSGGRCDGTVHEVRGLR